MPGGVDVQTESDGQSFALKRGYGGAGIPYIRIDDATATLPWNPENQAHHQSCDFILPIDECSRIVVRNG